MYSANAMLRMQCTASKAWLCVPTGQRRSLCDSRGKQWRLPAWRGVAWRMLLARGQSAGVVDSSIPHTSHFNA